MLKKICPICALVSLVWLTMLIGKWFGYNVNGDLLAMLMGGSAVGISYALAHKLSARIMAWKSISIPIAFAAMYALFHFAWIYFGLLAGGYVVTWWLFGGIDPVRGREGSQRPSVSNGIDINKELKNCC